MTDEQTNAIPLTTVPQGPRMVDGYLLVKPEHYDALKTALQDRGNVLARLEQAERGRDEAVALLRRLTDAELSEYIAIPNEEGDRQCVYCGGRWHLTMQTAPDGYDHSDTCPVRQAWLLLATAREEDRQ
jgi:hypothetical protein